jgi:hypothetical protein
MVKIEVITRKTVEEAQKASHEFMKENWNKFIWMDYPQACMDDKGDMAHRVTVYLKD